MLPIKVKSSCKTNAAIFWEVKASKGLWIAINRETIYTEANIQYKTLFIKVYQSQRGGTIFDLINVFSLLTERVYNMPCIFVIGKGISEVKKL